MDVNRVRRVSSAGYRLPDRPHGSRPPSAPPPPDRRRPARGAQEAEPREPIPERSDPVKRDRVWRELVWSERRGVREWEKNWDFLRNYDQMGQLKVEEPLPSSVSLFSESVPNTTNQTFGSRLSSPVGGELVRLDRISLWPGSHHRRKLDPEMLPC